jgi:serine phosphatase RsbU (regulator of sigma subunit)
MFGYPDLRAAPPADREVVLEPGEVVLLYTDGLVERRHLDIDAAVDGLRRTIERLGTTEPTELVDAVLSAYGAATSMDDLVVLVVRVGDPAP